MQFEGFRQDPVRDTRWIQTLLFGFRLLAGPRQRLATRPAEL
jgi:hypothetical protein